MRTTIFTHEESSHFFRECNIVCVGDFINITSVTVCVCLNLFTDQSLWSHDAHTYIVRSDLIAIGVFLAAGERDFVCGTTIIFCNFDMVCGKCTIFAHPFILVADRHIGFFGLLVDGDALHLVPFSRSPFHGSITAWLKECGGFFHP